MLILSTLAIFYFEKRGYLSSSRKNNKEYFRKNQCFAEFLSIILQKYKLHEITLYADPYGDITRIQHFYLTLSFYAQNYTHYGNNSSIPTAIEKSFPHNP